MKKTNQQILAEVNILLNALPSPKSYLDGRLAQEEALSQNVIKFLTAYVKAVKSNKEYFVSHDLSSHEATTIKDLLKERDFSFTYSDFGCGLFSNKSKYRIHVRINGDWD
jgi:hypothetical protein